MGFTLRFWSKSEKFPEYEVEDETGSIRKIGDPYKALIPQFWGRLDCGDPEWLITLCDDEGDIVTVPVYEVTDHVGWSESKYEN